MYKQLSCLMLLLFVPKLNSMYDQSTFKEDIVDLFCEAAAKVDDDDPCQKSIEDLARCIAGFVHRDMLRTTKRDLRNHLGEINKKAKMKRIPLQEFNFFRGCMYMVTANFYQTFEEMRENDTLETVYSSEAVCALLNEKISN